MALQCTVLISTFRAENFKHIALAQKRSSMDNVINVFKSGTPECTPKIESGAGAALILEIGSGEGAALNIFGSMVMSSTLTFSVH